MKVKRTRKIKRRVGGSSVEPKVLIVISSKSPNGILHDCLDSLLKVQIKNSPNYKVCVVDSDSDNMDVYDKIKGGFPQVEVHFIKNKNYEYGAWKFASETYPNYDIYFCIQDSIVIKKEVPLSTVDDKNAYIFFHKSGYTSNIGVKNIGKANMNIAGIKYNNIINSQFTLAQHSSFIVSNHVMKDIFKTLISPPKNKRGSRSYERVFGIYFIKKNIVTHDLQEYFTKTSVGRT
jgi:hypothetical protein